LAGIGLLAGCGGQGVPAHQNKDWLFGEVCQQVIDLNQNVSSEFYEAEDEPIEDPLYNAILGWQRHEDRDPAYDAYAQKLVEQQDQIMDIWNSADGSIEEIVEMAQQMQDTVDEVRDQMGL